MRLRFLDVPHVTVLSLNDADLAEIIGLADPSPCSAANAWPLNATAISDIVSVAQVSTSQSLISATHSRPGNPMWTARSIEIPGQCRYHFHAETPEVATDPWPRCADNLVVPQVCEAESERHQTTLSCRQ